MKKISVFIVIFICTLLISNISHAVITRNTSLDSNISFTKTKNQIEPPPSYTLSKSLTEDLIRGNIVSSSNNLIQKSRDRKISMKKLMVENPLVFNAIAIKESDYSKFPIDVQKNLEKRITITGQLIAIHTDDFKSHKSSGFKYYINTLDKQYSFHPTKDQSHFSGKDITVTGYVLDDMLTANVEIDPIIEPVLFRPASDPTLATKGDQKTLVILVKHSAVEPEPFNIPTARNLVFNSGMQAFMNEQSYNQISFSGDVFGWYIWPGAAYCLLPGNETLNLMLETYNIDIKLYSRLVFLVQNNDGGCSTIGKVNFGTNIIGGPHSISLATIGLNYYFSNYTGNNGFTYLDYALSHELGHSLGINHAKSLDCGLVSLNTNCTQIEYGNHFDTMGTGYISLHYNAYNKDLLGWLDNKILNITESGNYSINKFENGNGNIAAKIKVQGFDSTPYYLETRKGIGFDRNLNSASMLKNTQGLLINQINSTGISYLLDMHPTSASWYSDLVEQGSLNLPIAGAQNVFSDTTSGISIGPILGVTPTSTDFTVNIVPPVCNHIIHNATAIVYGSAFPGEDFQVYVNITNPDSKYCNPSIFNLNLSLPPLWTYDIYPSNSGMEIQSQKNGSMVVTLHIPESATEGSYNFPISIVNTARNETVLKSARFNIIPKPTIISVTPSFTEVGEVINIIGDYWGDEVEIGLTGLDVNAHTSYDEEMTQTERGIVNYTVPSEMTSCVGDDCNIIPTPNGQYLLELRTNLHTISKNITISSILPRINSISPEYVIPKNTVSINGKRFNEVKNLVIFTNSASGAKIKKNLPSSNNGQLIVFPSNIPLGRYEVKVEVPSLGISNPVFLNVVNTVKSLEGGILKIRDFELLNFNFRDMFANILDLYK